MQNSSLKTIILSFFLLGTLLSSEVSFAKRYIIPQDKDVIIKINSIESDEVIYPFNIKVLVWNIYKGKNKNWINEFSDFSNNKDLVLLQEAFLNQKMLGLLASNKLFSYNFATSWIDLKYGATPSGIATGSSVTSSETTWQRSYFKEPILRTPKMTLFTKFKLAGMDKELLVGNIHAINFVRAYKLRHMLDQAAQIISKHKGPVLFAGDFNTWTKTKINNMNSVFKKLGMKSVSFKNDLRKRFLGKVLDHAWIRGLQVQSSKIPISSGSDHAPLIFELGVY